VDNSPGHLCSPFVRSVVEELMQLHCCYSRYRRTLLLFLLLLLLLLTLL
jgi:hypothetical protein